MMRAAIALLVFLSACADPPGPVEIPPQQVPFPLARQDVTEPPGAVEMSFRVALVRGPRLVTVPRDAITNLSREEIVLRTLLTGPTRNESDRGLTTAIPAPTRLLSIRIFEGVAEVDLSQEFQAAAASEGFLLRVAQIVTTLTGLQQITAVRFSIDGQVASVPTDRGQIVQRPVTAADYAERLPRRRR